MIALGAYERDNFGDLLYREIMADVFTGRVDAEFAAPFAAEASPGVAGVPAAAPLLGDAPVDAVWTVGGEVGATDMGYVHRTRFGDEAGFAELSEPERDAIVRERSGGVLYDSPYIPRPSAHDGTRGARLILNSIGLAGIPHQAAWRRIQLLATLREASFVSVRDSRSAEYLSRSGIPHTLAPDLVHTLTLTRPAPAAGDYALVHLSDFQIDAHGFDAWADALAGSPDLRRLPVRLFIAGTATGHDSVETAERLAQRLSDTDPTWDVRVSDARGVWPRVDEIAASALWAGSSLHGRIVAQSYGVPRLSFTKGKLDIYADTWDPGMPARVGPGSLSDAVGAALSVPGDPTDDTARSLAQAAHRSVEDALALVCAPADPVARASELLDRRVDEAGALARHARELQERVDVLGNSLSAARADLDRTRRRAEAAEGELAAIHGSRSWTIAQRISGAARTLKPRRG